jgi:GH24 family phage-related lysozyme (muramidase)
VKVVRTVLRGGRGLYLKPSPLPDFDVKVITLLDAENLLRADLKGAEDAVSDLITVPLNNNEFSALVSFTFNLGGRHTTRLDIT